MSYIDIYCQYKTYVLLHEMEMQNEIILEICLTLCEEEDKYNYKMTETMKSAATLIKIARAEKVLA